MSSATFQTAPHQSTALSSPPLSTSNRPYTSSHSPPTAEANYAPQSNTAATASPSSRRPPSRKTSSQAYDPTRDPNNPVVAARTAMSYQTSHNSPQADRSTTSMPPVAPPRTSSNQQGGSSRRNYSSERIAHASRQSQPDPQRSSTRTDPNGATENGQRSRRQANTHFAQDMTGRPSEQRDNRGNVVIPIRTQQSTSKPSREVNENAVRAAQDAHSRSHQAPSGHDDAMPPPVAGSSPEERRGGRIRHDYSNQRQRGTAKFGDFILGNTIGEGEFGKVKLGWKQDSSVQVAIKLIKRDTVGSNPSRLAKIRREVTILRELQHPNIVQLIDMVETDRYIGIILEYASGGELFDYILNHRYLKDNSARRLFAQLVSGVGYLHKKGIVHRDLKLENLLLDRNRNIIITDFGFANTFDPNEELAEEEEFNLTDRDFVKRNGLDKIKSNGMRKGDLMQTSCGSPCYAAPELVVSDCLYTGRKVDVWSCGVILYAMLAGYLPFDDDPANPEGDNINLLYKYIVSTPLTFPEYVTPHARDLLRRILVPNPRKRADLFEVARHSWLSDYSHAVEFITSSTTLPADVQKTIAAPEEFADAPLVVRSNSVREAHKQKAHSPTAVGGLAKATGKIDTEADSAQRTPKDAKRRTVQVEYVAPTTQTQRGADGELTYSASSPSHGRGDSQAVSQDKPLPRDPPVSRDGVRPSSSRRPQSSQRAGAPARGPREQRPITENFYMPTSTSATRPQTGGSLSSAASMGMQHYGQPAPPAVADTNAEGRIAQPSNAEEAEMQGRPSVSVPPKFARVSGMNDGQGPSQAGRGHKRSSTLGDFGSKLLGRNGSVFSGKNKKRSEQQPEKSRKYPPVSMQQPMSNDEPGSRQSMDSRASRRSFSMGFGKKRSGSMTGSQGSGEKTDRRRFSFLPPSFSLKAVGLGKESGTPPSDMGSQGHLPIQDPRGDPPRSFTAHGDARGSSPIFEPGYNNRPQGAPPNAARHQRYASAQLDNRRPNAIPPYLQSGTHYSAGSDSSIDNMRRPPTEPQMTSHQRTYQHGYSDSQDHLGQRTGTPRSSKGGVVLQKNAKKFTDAYDQDKGSSGAATRVMDFFRRRGKARGGEER